MKKFVVVIILLLSFKAAEANVATAIAKLFEAVGILKAAPEAANAARAAGAVEAEQVAQKAAKAKGVENSITATIHPAIDEGLSAAHAGDIAEYKKHKLLADKGDAISMMKLADMVDARIVVDSKLPHFDYWLFQAAAQGNKLATSRLQKDCTNLNVRKVDAVFDEKCRKW